MEEKITSRMIAAVDWSKNSFFFIVFLCCVCIGPQTKKAVCTVKALELIDVIFFLLKHCFHHERIVFKFECLSEDEHCTLLERHISIFSRIYATKRYNTNELELDLICVAFFQCPMAVIKWRKGHEHPLQHSRCE